MITSKPSLRSGFDCIIRPAPSGAGRTTPSQSGHYPLKYSPGWDEEQTGRKTGGTKIRNNPERSGTSKPHMASIYNEIIHFYKKQLNKCRCNCV